MKRIIYLSILILLICSNVLFSTTASVAEIRILPVSINPENNSVLCKTLYIPNYEGGYSINEIYFGFLIIYQNGNINEFETFYYNYRNYNYKESILIIEKLLKKFRETRDFVAADQREIDNFLKRNNFTKSIPIKKYSAKSLSFKDFEKEYDIKNQKTIRNYGITQYHSNDIELIFEYNNIAIVKNSIDLFISKGKKHGAEFNIANWFFYNGKMINRKFDIFRVDGIVIKN